jgi:hypothetical protein
MVEKVGWWGVSRRGGYIHLFHEYRENEPEKEINKKGILTWGKW